MLKAKQGELRALHMLAEATLAVTPDHADTVLAHQCRDVGVGHQVAADDVVAHGLLVHLPEAIALAGAAHVRTVEQRSEIAAGGLRVERVLEDPGVGGR